MQEIKFRGKSLVTGEWLCGSLINNAFFLSNDGSPIPYILDTDKIEYDSFKDIAEYLDEFEVLSETVGQYTGLKDKNGKEIYKGDIIEFDKWMPNETCVIRGEVYWSDKGYWAVRNKDGKFLELLGRTENPEQIGNIYENPELI